MWGKSRYMKMVASGSPKIGTHLTVAPLRMNYILKRGQGEQCKLHHKVSEDGQTIPSMNLRLRSSRLPATQPSLLGMCWIIWRIFWRRKLAQAERFWLVIRRVLVRVSAWNSTAPDRWFSFLCTISPEEARIRSEIRPLLLLHNFQFVICCRRLIRRYVV